MQFSPISSNLIPLRSKHSPQHPVLKHPESMFLPYIQTPRFTLIQNRRQNCSFTYVIIFKLLGSKREDKRFWTDWCLALPEFNLFFIFSWIKFWFLAVVPKYLNFAIFLISGVELWALRPLLAYCTSPGW
jgi:hypothetical protein